MLEIVVTSTILIVCILTIRKIFMGKINPVIQYSLWLLVLIRLMLPFSIPSPVSVMNAIPEYTQFTNENRTTLMQTLPQQEVFSALQSPPMPETLTLNRDNASIPASFKIQPKSIIFFVWFCVFVIIFLRVISNNVMFARKIRREAVLLSDLNYELPVFIMNGLPSPCLFGIIKPIIIITSEASENNNIKYVLAHELCHHRYKDNWVSLLRSLCCAVYWFNPLVWTAAHVSKLDCEMACDERVVKSYNEIERINYGKTLLSLVHENSGSVLSISTTMAGKNMKRRIHMIAKRPKSFMLASLLCLTLIFTIGIITLTSAAKNNSDAQNEVSLENYQHILDNIVSEYNLGSTSMSVRPETLEEYPTVELYLAHINEEIIPILEQMTAINNIGWEPDHDYSVVTFTDGQPIELYWNVEPFNANGRAPYPVRVKNHDEVMLPLEPIFDKANIDYAWDSSEQTLVITYESFDGINELILEPDKDTFIVNSKNGESIWSIESEPSGKTWLTSKKDGLYINQDILSEISMVEIEESVSSVYFPLCAMIYHDLHKVVLSTHEYSVYQNYAKKQSQTLTQFNREDYPLTDNVKITLNQEEIILPHNPIVISSKYQDYIMLPFVDTCEFLEMGVSWDAERNIATVTGVDSFGENYEYIIKEREPLLLPSGYAWDNEPESLPVVIDGVLYVYCEYINQIMPFGTRYMQIDYPNDCLNIHIQHLENANINKNDEIPNSKDEFLSNRPIHSYLTKDDIFTSDDFNPDVVIPPINAYVGDVILKHRTALYVVHRNKKGKKRHIVYTFDYGLQVLPGFNLSNEELKEARDTYFNHLLQSYESTLFEDFSNFETSWKIIREMKLFMNEIEQENGVRMYFCPSAVYWNLDDTNDHQKYMDAYNPDELIIKMQDMWICFPPYIAPGMIGTIK